MQTDSVTMPAHDAYLAHALASPVRIERSTSSLLPSDLLLTLHLKPHPETSAPWLLPLSLSSSNVPKQPGPPIRFLAHKHIAAFLTRKKSHWRPAIERRFADVLGSKGLEQLVWREDMPELLLKLLRDRVMDKLTWYYKSRRRLAAVASPASSDLEELDDVACVLIYRTLHTRRANEIQKEAQELALEADKWATDFRAHYGARFDPHTTPPPNSEAREATHNPPSWYEPVVPRLTGRALFPPLHFPTTRWRGNKVAVYSLTDMLGEEKANELLDKGRQNEAIGQETCWVMKRARPNVPAELLLMQLQTYLTEPGVVLNLYYS